ncbi:MAG: DUF5063 domain-containing protein [Bacteroidaceae bacterium]|nr:DUF5063 domain-containing protein [Bacteroidaceae bacterium]
MKQASQLIFERNSVEFVTVAAEYCAFIERSEGQNRKELVDTLLKILPLLYIKASMLPECEVLGEDNLETFVSEDEYEVIRINLQELLADRDDYLDVFVEDMKYSDTPIRKSIAEDLSDIYQVVKDFICQFRSGLNETMHDALAQCREHFISYWGQTLVNTMRALHEVKYSHTDNDEEEEFDD